MDDHAAFCLLQRPGPAALGLGHTVMSWLALVGGCSDAVLHHGHLFWLHRCTGWCSFRVFFFCFLQWFRPIVQSPRINCSLPAFVQHDDVQYVPHNLLRGIVHLKCMQSMRAWPQPRRLEEQAKDETRSIPAKEQGRKTSPLSIYRQNVGNNPCPGPCSINLSSTIWPFLGVLLLVNHSRLFSCFRFTGGRSMYHIYLYIVLLRIGEAFALQGESIGSTNPAIASCI